MADDTDRSKLSGRPDSEAEGLVADEYPAAPNFGADFATHQPSSIAIEEEKKSPMDEHEDEIYPVKDDEVSPDDVHMSDDLGPGGIAEQFNFDDEEEGEEQKGKAGNTDIDLGDDATANAGSVYTKFVVSFLFVIMFFLSNPVQKVSDITVALQNELETSYWTSEPASTFQEVASLEDLKDYMQVVFLPKVFSDPFIAHYNYVAGVRFNLKKAEYEDNPHSIYEDAVPRVWKHNEMAADKTNKENMDGEDTSSFGNDDKKWSYDDGGGFNYAGAFTDLWIGYNYTQAEEAWEIMQDQWINESMISFVVEIIVQNSNFQTTVYYSLIFTQYSSGSIHKQSLSYGIFPEMYSTLTDTATAILVLSVVYLMGLVFQFYNLIQMLLRIGRVLWTQLKFIMWWYEIIDITSVVLVVIAIGVYWDTVLVYIPDFEIPLTSSGDFEDLVDQFYDFRFFVRVSGIATLLITFRIIVIMRTKYPSFGVLFDTIRTAKSDIMYFGIITLALLCGFVFMGHLVFGIQLQDFSSVTESFISLFIMILGDVDFMKLYQENKDIAPLFFIVFNVLFILILVNMFLAIVMATYIELRNKNFTITQAKARIIKEELDKVNQAWFDLIFCKSPVRTLENEAIEYAQLCDKEKTVVDENVRADIEVKKATLKTILLAETNKSMFEIIKFNAAKTVQVKNQKYTIEQVKEQLQQRIKLINQEKLEREKLAEEDEGNNEKQFKMIMDMLSFVIFIVVFVMMLVFQFRIQESFWFEEALRSSLVKAEFDYTDVGVTFEEINKPDMVYAWIHQIMVPAVYNDYLYDHNRIFGDPLIRMTIRRAEFSNNDVDSTKSAIYKIRDEQILSATEEVNEQDGKQFIGQDSNHDYEYINKGKNDAYRSLGGNVEYLVLDQEQAAIQINRIGPGQDDLMGNQTAILTFDFAHYNANLGMFCLTAVSFTQQSSGRIQPEMQTQSMTLELYESKDNIFKFILELIFVMFTLRYLYVETKAWKEEFDILKAERQKKMKNEKTATEVRIALGKLKEPKGVDSCINYFTAFINFIIEYVVIFVRAVSRYLKKDFFNCLDALSISLSITMIAFLVMIFNNEFRDSFTLPDDWDNKLPEFTDLAQLDSQYIFVAALNTLVIFLRLLQYFQFSKQLSLLTDILRSAILDIGFFIVMFLIILVGYTMMGNLVLGHYDTNFATIAISFLTCYEMLLGEFDYNQMKLADSGMAPLFFMTFMILFYLLLLNMFIAIIGAHFDDLKPDKTKDHRGFFGKITDVIQEKCKQWRQKKNNEVIEVENPDDDDENGPGGMEQNHVHQDNAESDEDAYVDELMNPAANKISGDIGVQSNNEWLIALEKVLFEKSGNTLEFVKLKNSKKGSEEAVLSPSEDEIVVIVHKWKDPDPSVVSYKEKLQIWKRLCLLHMDNKQKDEELAVQTGNIEREEQLLSEIQQDLWRETNRRDKLKFWLGHQDSFLDDKNTKILYRLTPEEKVGIWNNITFSTKNLEMLGDTNLKQTEIWDKADPEDRLKWLQKLDNKKKSKHIKKLKKLQDQDQIIEHILAREIGGDDERLMLWAGMEIQDKLLIFINEPVKVEADILANMILCDLDSNVFMLEEASQILEKELDNVIYEKHDELANWQAEKYKNNQAEARKEARDIEDKAAENYLKFLEKSLQDNKQTLATLEQAYKRTQFEAETQNADS